MSNITFIPARPQVRNQQSSQERPKLRVCAYCRVSTDSEEQATSYEAQVNYYTSYIKSREDWEYVGVFADDGISGCNTKKREQFNKMIAECEAGHIDMIITKSISRFARNTLDCLKYIRQLKDMRIPVYFEKENINTMEATGEVLITIMASLAQQESQSLSQNVKMGIQYRYKSGKVLVNHSRFLGYTKDSDGNLIVDQEQAKIVKRIYREYLEGASLKEICKGLMADGILTGAGNKVWRATTLHKILTNEKYIGDALLQKTYTVDFLNKKRVKNNGIAPQYYVEGNHEAIIPKDIFMQVQEELSRRANLHSGTDMKKRVYSNKYALSSICICEKCGEIYRRTSWYTRKGEPIIVWRCVNRVEHGPEVCDSPTVKEEILHKAILKAINKELVHKEVIIKRLQKAFAKSLNLSYDKKLNELDGKLNNLQQELVEKATAQKDYTDLLDEIDALKEQKQQLLTSIASEHGRKDKIADMVGFLEEHSHSINEYDDKIVRRLIERVIVHSEKQFTIEFKSGERVRVSV